MSIAFFDLDKTLLAENSAKLLLKAQWQARHINRVQMLSASYWLVKYHLGFTKLDDVIIKTLATLEGESQKGMLEMTEKFFNESIKNLYRPGALKAIEHHRKLGDRISLLTSTFDGLSNLVKEDLKLDHCLCTHLEVDEDGFYTGKSLGPPCFGRNKIIFAEKLCELYNTSLDQCTFYTDSASDIPLLELVRYPVAVNPDPHLRAMAQLKKWPVNNWGKPLWMDKKKSSRNAAKK